MEHAIETAPGARRRRTCLAALALLRGGLGRRGRAGGVGGGLRPRLRPGRPWRREQRPGRRSRGLLPGLLPGLGQAADLAPGPRLALLEAAAPARTDRLAPVEPVAELSSPRVSGLAWRSGASCPETGLGTFRGRRLDVNVAFAGPHETWDAMLDHFSTSRFKALANATPQFVVSLPMLPKSADGQLARCAAGAFDGHFRQFGALFARIGAGQAVVRLGWEANKSRPWSPETAADVPDYVACFRREARALKSAAPGLKVEWTVGRISSVRFNLMNMYPGDAHVDHLGLHYYDNVGPKISTQAAWDQHYDATWYGGPRGLGRWLREAKARGKRLAVSEWGVWDQGSLAKADNPVYVENMHRFFRNNAASIAYENYYNCPTSHQLYPSTRFTRPGPGTRSSGRPAGQ
jgi:hypothetical protein